MKNTQNVMCFILGIILTTLFFNIETPVIAAELEVSKNADLPKAIEEQLLSQDFNFSQEFYLDSGKKPIAVVQLHWGSKHNKIEFYYLEGVHYLMMIAGSKGKVIGHIFVPSNVFQLAD